MSLSIPFSFGWLLNKRRLTLSKKVKVYVYLYSALRKAHLMHLDMDHTVLSANYTMRAFTPQPQSITALWLVLILPSHGGQKDGWLHTEIKCRLRESNLETATHPSSNRAQRRLTSLI